jgi:hypothetical protein
MDDISDTASDDQKDTEYVSNSRTIKFKGNEDEWRTWKGKTIATAMQHRFYQALFMQESLATMEEVNAGTASKSARKVLRSTTNVRTKDRKTQCRQSLVNEGWALLRTTCNTPKRA